MMDPASAAAMSDPTLNRWFRRRWVEPANQLAPETAQEAHANDELAVTGLALLQEWRRSRDQSSRAHR